MTSETDHLTRQSIIALHTLLREIFHAPDKDGSSPAEAMRLRYTVAIFHVAKFLRLTGADELVERRFGELGAALFDLGNGVVHPALKQGPISNRAVDRSDVWNLRVGVAIALEYLSQGKAVEADAKTIAREFPGLSRLLRPGVALDSAIVNWRRRLRDRAIKSAMAIDAYHEVGLVMFAAAKDQFSPADLRQVGFTMLRSIEVKAKDLITDTSADD